MELFKKSLITLACLFGSSTFAQQITINDSYTPQQLIENNLIQGCVETSNIVSEVNGQVNGFSSFGYFEKGSSNFPFENGIMLSTGKAVSGGNGQNTAVLNEGQNNWLTDIDLETALGIDNTLNATSIEFEFISISNQIQFNYILASEEYYSNFPCNYSDGFAFLIREAGTNNPYVNIAVIPGTSTPVNTNTIHANIVGFCGASNAQYFEGYNVGDTNYNGRTKVLTATADIVPNVSYQIKLVIADQTDKNYDSAVFIEGNSFNATVDLGEDLTTCAETVTLNGDIQNPEATYSWWLNDTVISGANQPTLTISQSGTYTIKVEIPLAGTTCVIEDTIEVNVSSTQTATPISDYEQCDDPSGDGIESFDLSTQNQAVLASVPNSTYAISYHYTASEAQNNINPITSSIQNTISPQAIHVRIEDVVNGCLAYSSFNLVVHELPNITQPTLLLACDSDEADGITTINLTDKDDEITNGQSNLLVSYHTTQSDANSGSNPLPQPYVSSNASEQVFVRVINSETGCVNTTILDIDVANSPIINTEDHFIDGCDSDLDGFTNFDLTSIIDEVLNGLTNVSVTFHVSNEDALSGTNAIVDDTNYLNTISEKQIIYIRVEDNTTGCASVTPIEIHPNLLLTATVLKDFSQCDEGNDNSEAFDLTNIAEIIINDLEDVEVIFYQTLEDQTNQVNALDPLIGFVVTSSPQTLYITLVSPTCTEIAEIKLILSPITEFDSIGVVDYCDTDADGFTIIDFSSFDTRVLDGESGYSVSYFLTEEDAEGNTNPLPNFYTNISNPQTIYVRAASDDLGCADSSSFVVNVLPAPETITPTNITICDADQDGFSRIDLTQKINESVTDPANSIVSFHLSATDAENGTNELSNLTNYNSNTQTIYLRAENRNSGCYALESFQIIVNTLPAFTNISNYKICEEQTDGIGDFLFRTKDSEILNGQTGKKVLYYRSQADANNRTNAINKNSVYQNISNPQTIFVRVENLSDQNCYGTSPFTIEVGTNPRFNIPSDLSLCDEISNDGSELFDLSGKITEISQGINESLNISFHTSNTNAQNGTNPLPLQYANTVNPQQIYVRINNGTICNSVTSFTLNVVQAPDANLPEPLIMCDADYDGLVIFDLTLAAVDILDVRQDNLEVAYYESLEDLDANMNAIQTPSSFANSSSTQTVYVRVTNTISYCYLAIPLDLIVNLPPAINQFGSLQICDTIDHSYDLTTINSIIVDSATNTNISYYSTAEDALDGTNSLNDSYMYQTNNDQIFARVEDNTSFCFVTYPFRLKVNPIPTAANPNNLEACDDDFDGYLEFDLQQQNAVILGNQNVSNHNVTYHNTIQDANSGNNELPNLYAAQNNEIIYARVEKTATGCYQTTQFSIIIHPRPNLNVGDQVICIDNLPLLVSANTNNSGDVYSWSTNETTPEIEITQIGTYTVTVTTPFGCVSTEVFEVIESEQANIDIVETVDFSDPNNITITISGIGNYLYILDDNEPQDSNVFQNVPIGYHTVTIIDLNGCAEITKEVLVIDYPKFMTPNDDGYFDNWHIAGVETLPGTVIYIYDRYGKQLSFLTSQSKGWDGTYNGQMMPATDYWFVADVKRNQIEFQVKGHFALRR